VHTDIPSGPEEHAHDQQPESRITAAAPDDPSRELALARSDGDDDALHISVAGDTYTILLTGDDTDGRYTLIDMHVPPAAARRRIATTSKRRSRSSTARSRSCSAT
jgi:hypothetical protein